MLQRTGEVILRMLPLYLDFFELVHNARHRGKALLGALLAELVVP